MVRSINPYYIIICFIFIKGDNMGKDQDVKKESKKKPTKTLIEKRKEKQEKKKNK